MTEARERSEWAHTSTLMALIANAHRDAKKSRPFKPTDFDPFAQSEKKNVNNIDALRIILEGPPCTSKKQEIPKTSPAGENRKCI